MYGYETSDDNQPVTWVRGHALYAAHLLVVVFVASMLVTTVLRFAQADRVLGWLTFTSDQVLRGEAWRVLTYGLVNEPSFGFVISMFMIAWFGREVEKFFGRKKFLMLYGGLYLLTPLVLTVVGLWRPGISLAGQTGSLGLFIAFATLYPNVSLLLNILAKWMAAILVGIYTLMALSARDEVALISLWTTVGFAFAFVRYQQGHFALPRVNLSARKPKLTVIPGNGEGGDNSSNVQKQVSAKPVKSEASTMAEVDALLDKIALSGFASLTPKERARLDAAQAELSKRRGGRS